MEKKLWGGRFKKGTNKEFDAFSRSIEYDYKLAEYDVYHSLIHVEALSEERIISSAERKKLILALEGVLKDIKSGRFKFNSLSEDIHTDIQNKVEEKVGGVAFKLHTFRSRNEQIVFDEKFYCLREAESVSSLIKDLMKSLSYFSRRYNHILFPGYTHTQRAQVVKFSDYIGAYLSMLRRDLERLRYFIKSNVLWVRSGALAGSPVSRRSYLKAIRMFKERYGEKVNIQVASNTLDNVASRDFIIDFLSVLSCIQMHLSRMAEDFILYSTKEFGFFDLPEEFCTGSSLMPHKKNPDFLELVRGTTGRVYGNLISLLVTMKGLPLTYNRDMQLDKESLFSSVEIVKSELKIMVEFIKGVRLNINAIKTALSDESLYATELATFLVYKGLPFKEAHSLVGKLIRYAEDRGFSLKDMPESVLRSFHRDLRPAVIKKIVNPENSTSSRK